MQIKPVTKANNPEYPTASEIDIPKVLNASKPNKWKRNAVIGAVMLGMAFGTVGCERKRASYEVVKNKAKIDFLLVWSKKGTLSNTGTDRDIGEMAGVISIPKRSLTESEAMETILQKLNQNGIVMDTTFSNQRTDSIILQRNMPFNPLAEYYPIKWKIDNYKYYLRQLKPNQPVVPDNFYLANVVTDAINCKKRLAVVFFSENDRRLLKDPLLDEIFFYSKKKILNHRMNVSLNLKSNEYCFAVFYPPSRIPFTESEELHIKYSKDSLRAQVRDFLAWYKENKGKK